MASNLGRARDELAEVLDIARQSLADVRIVSSGYRNISLAKEAASVTSLLAEAGISTRIEISCGMLEEKVDTVLATVLREAATNMLRHSSARNAVIEAGITGEGVRLLVANDGVPRSARSGREGGGLENLTARMQAIGGQLTASIRDDGWFTVLAEAPLAPPTADGRTPADRARQPELSPQAHWLSTTPAPGLDEDTPATGPGAEAQTRAVPEGPRLARAVMLAVFCSYAAIQTINALTSPVPEQGYKLAANIAAVYVLFALAVLVTWEAAERWPLRRRLAALTAMALVTYLPLIVLGEVWGDMAGFFAGSALLLLSGWAAWTLFAGAVGSMLVAAVALNLPAWYVAYLTLSSLILGLVVFGLARLSQVIRYVDARRGELAQLAVIRERMRFARDLHDLLGYSLSAVTLKAELTRRLMASNLGRARDELAEVLDIARQALADVRIVSSGYRNISLAKEATSVSSLLAQAGISTRIQISSGMLEEKVDTVLATVLREAVTNILRHSTARNATIEAGTTAAGVRLLVANDGVPRSARSGREGGGLENLATRMQVIGGHLTVSIRDDGWFTVLAQAPLAPPTAAGTASLGDDSSQIEGA
jgi:signal transduction histidine kinase